MIRQLVLAFSLLWMVVTPAMASSVVVALPPLPAVTDDESWEFRVHVAVNGQTSSHRVTVRGRWNDDVWHPAEPCVVQVDASDGAVVMVHVEQDSIAPLGLSGQSTVQAQTARIQTLSTIGSLWLEHPSRRGEEYRGAPLSCRVTIDGQEDALPLLSFHLRQYNARRKNNQLPSPDSSQQVPRPVLLELGRDHRVTLQLKDGRRVELQVPANDLGNALAEPLELVVPFPNDPTGAAFGPRGRRASPVRVIPMSTWKGSNT